MEQIVQVSGKRNKNIKKTSPCEIQSRIEQKIKKIKETKEGLSGEFIINTLSPVCDFIGVFAQNELSSLLITSYPVSFVVNLDNINQSGSHWIGIRISNKQLEIYDSFALDPNSWSKKPRRLLKFISRYKKSHKILLTPRLQSSLSNMCGFYCIYFILFRLHRSFYNCLSVFSQNLMQNDRILNSVLTNFCE